MKANAPFIAWIEGFGVNPFERCFSYNEYYVN